MRFLSLALCLACLHPLPAQNPLESIIQSHAAEFGPWASDPDKYEVQILYSEIVRHEDGSVSLNTHRWGADSTRYFYPASAVKLPTAVLALQRLNELGVVGLGPQTLLFHGAGLAPAAAPQTPVTADTSSRNGYPSVENYIRRIFLASDNDAYNRLFEWLGPGYLNRSLAAVGIPDTRVLHRLSVIGFDAAKNEWLNPVMFADGVNILYKIGERHDPFFRALPRVQGQSKGKGYTDNLGRLIEEPFDFTRKNYLSLRALHDVLARVVLPEAFDPDQRFNLTGADYKLLRGALSQRPRESDSPRYNRPDNFVKFWIYGDQGPDVKIPDHVRLLNKVGWAYGYLTDAAYIQDAKTGVEFILVGTIYVNEDDIFNDGVYEYDRIGLPFFGQLGRAVMDYERQKRRP